MLALGAAETARAQTMHRSPHKEETANIVGLKGVVTGQFNRTRNAVGGGFSAFYERNLIPGWLEVEGAFASVWFEDETAFSFDLFFKKPFHVNETINPYVGIGPNVSIVLAQEQEEEINTTVRSTQFGLLFNAGSYFWFGRHRWGLDVEVVYILVFASELIHELAFEIGPAFRF